ncbi:hypothetical protein MFLAVUS_006342 [Mucor flavus]|uniref:Uncharacterized protein n=1 Tax=Mucor flavus TaxID=439312 RepID=A0ABP9Z1A5_9FUNG
MIDQPEQSESATSSEELVYRTFSVSVNKIFRADLHNSIKVEVKEKLQRKRVPRILQMNRAIK